MSETVLFGVLQPMSWKADSSNSTVASKGIDLLQHRSGPRSTLIETVSGAIVGRPRRIACTEIALQPGLRPLSNQLYAFGLDVGRALKVEEVVNGSRGLNLGFQWTGLRTRVVAYPWELNSQGWDRVHCDLPVRTKFC